MPEIETEERKTRTEAVTYLRNLADELDADGPFTHELGGQSVELDPTESLTVKMEGEWGEGGAGTKESIEFELVWRGAAETSEPGAADQ